MPLDPGRGAARERAVPSAEASGSFQALANESARKHSPDFIIAQTIRASLLASATVTRRAGLRASSAKIQSRNAPLRLPTPWSSEVAESTSSFLMYRFLCLVMAPSAGLPPVEFCRGTRPSQAAKSRPV